MCSDTAVGFSDSVHNPTKTVKCWAGRMEAKAVGKDAYTGVIISAKAPIHTIVLETKHSLGLLLPGIGLVRLCGKARRNRLGQQYASLISGTCLYLGYL